MRQPEFAITKNSALRIPFLFLMGVFSLACGGSIVGSIDPGSANPTAESIADAAPGVDETQAQPPESTAEIPVMEEADQPPNSPEVFSDGFDEPNGWAEEQTGRYSMGRGEGGVYRMEFFLAGDEQILVSLQPHAFGSPLKDMDAHTEGTGMSADGAYGLVCRYADPDNFYTFHISTDSRYWLYKRVAGVWTNLGSGISESILEENTIDLQCVGSAISAYVNGDLVAEVMDDSLAEGNAGLFAQPLGGEVLGAWSYYAVFQSFEMTFYP